MDECYHHLLARDSLSLSEMFANARPSGHPLLWNILLYFLQFFTTGIFAVQIFHCFIATLCIFIIFQESPFSWTEKILIAGGYFFFYEYNIIAKNYMPGFILLFLAVVFFLKNRPLILISISLGLACNMHLFTAFVAAPLFAYMIIERKYPLRTLVWPAVAFFVLMAFAFLQIIPPASVIEGYSSFDKGIIDSSIRWDRVLSVLPKGLLNLADFREYHFLNTSWLLNQYPAAFNYLNIPLLILIVLLLRKKPRLLFLFFTPIILMMIFVYFMPLAVGARYWGYCYVMLVICCWLLFSEHSSEPASHNILLFFIAFQVVSSIFFVVSDLKLPYSNAENAAAIIQQRRADLNCFAEGVVIGPSLSAQTGKKVYYPAAGIFQSFSYWVGHNKLTPSEFVSKSYDDLNVLKTDSCFLVLNKPLHDSIVTARNLVPVCALEDAIFPSENYFVYLLGRKSLHD
jgi:hypothetical protein